MTATSIPHIADEKLRATLADLLHQAAFAAHLIGHLDDKAHADLIGQIGEHVDTIAHELTELLGDRGVPPAPDAAALDGRSDRPQRLGARDGAPMLTSVAGGAPCCSDRLGATPARAWLEPAVRRLRSPPRYEGSVRTIAGEPRERHCRVRGGNRRLTVHTQAPVAARSELCRQLRRTADVLFIACIERDDLDPLLTRPPPIIVPSLARRTAVLDKVIAEFATDAIAELGAPHTGFAPADHAWVRQHAATSLAEIEKATLRLIALRASRNLSHAAEQLGMASVSLSRWLSRRRPPPTMLSVDQSHQ